MIDIAEQMLLRYITVKDSLRANFGKRISFIKIMLQPSQVLWFRCSKASLPLLLIKHRNILASHVLERHILGIL